MEAGCLDLIAIGDNGRIAPMQKGGAMVTWHLHQGDIRRASHVHFVDATGQPADPALDPSLLTQSLLEQNLIEEVLVPFQGEPSKDDLNHPLVVQRHGRSYLRPPGAHIDLRNFALWSQRSPGADAAQPVYYMGPLTMGQVAFPYDLSVVTTAAERGVIQLISRGVLCRKQQDEALEDPEPMWGWTENAKGDLNGQMFEMTKWLHDSGIVHAKQQPVARL